jgi:hypothetical protein
LYDYFGDYKVGDLVVLLQNLEWNDVIGIRGEICIITDIFQEPNEDQFFTFRLVLGDGRILDVWPGEIKKLKHD